MEKVTDEKIIDNILSFLDRVEYIKPGEVFTWSTCLTFLHSLKDDENGKKAKKILEETDGKERKV